MIIKELYTGGGVSLSPLPGEGRHLSGYVRLIADDGRAITDGCTVTTCTDVPVGHVGFWVDCDALPEDEEITAEEALDELREVLE